MLDLGLTSTIVAVITPPGSGGRSLLRIAGPDAKPILARTLDLADYPQWAGSTRAVCIDTSFQLPVDHWQLPVTLYWWPDDRSFTGQPQAELAMPGAPPLVEAVLCELIRNGARAAERGEFSLRAFLKGKIDLLQAEGVFGVVHAKGQAELQLALTQLAGNVSTDLRRVHDHLLDTLADLEAGLDFTEEDIEFVSAEEVSSRIDTALGVLAHLRQRSVDRMTSRPRFRVVLAGLANAGKSSLMNALSGGQTAIVSETPGTTRDYVVTNVELDGLSFDLIDTAGFEAAETELTSAMEKARTIQLSQADLIVWCSAADLLPQEAAADDAARRFVEREHSWRVLHVRTKSDLSCPFSRFEGAGAPHVEASDRGSPGIGELEDAITNRLSGDVGASVPWIGMSAVRCEESLHQTISALQAAQTNIGRRDTEELVAADLRAALNALGQILGTIHTEDLLGRIFSRFCIGK